MIWTAMVKGREIEVTDRDLAAFQYTYVDPGLAARMSKLIWVDMYVYEKELGIVQQEIIRSIQNLEAENPAVGMKLPTQFKHKPLAGLWHGHINSGVFLPINIAQHLSGKMRSRLIADFHKIVRLGGDDELISNRIAHRTTTLAVDERSIMKSLTGEWIIFCET